MSQSKGLPALTLPVGQSRIEGTLLSVTVKAKEDCKHCGRMRIAFGVTCGRSLCQQKEYIEQSKRWPAKVKKA